MSFPYSVFLFSVSMSWENKKGPTYGGPQARGKGSPGGVLGGSTVPARGNPRERRSRRGVPV